MSPNERSNSIITKGFWLAGAFNVIGVLVFSKIFTNDLLSSLDPVVFSWLGLVAIMLWGFAYCSVARSYQFVPYLLLVFFVEKMIYTMTWVKWLTKNGSTLPLACSFFGWPSKASRNENPNRGPFWPKGAAQIRLAYKRMRAAPLILPQSLRQLTALVVSPLQVLLRVLPQQSNLKNRRETV